MENCKITIIGEVLIDWVCLDKTLDLNNANDFIKAPGGAPANVAVGLAKQNYPVQFVGGFAKDVFGPWLKNYVASYGIDLSYSQDIENANTRCAYVLTAENGERVFIGFSKMNNADSMLEKEKINYEAFLSSPITYFGSFLQAKEHSREVIESIVSKLGNENIVVYDPNLRFDIWESKELAVKTVEDTFRYVDVLKLSDDEINLFSGTNDIEESAQIVFEKYNPKLLVVTMGAEGSYYINKNGCGFVKPFKVDTVELTGAGDGFVSGLLGGIYDYAVKNASRTEYKEKLANLTSAELEKILTKSNAIGALATTKPGAMSGLPTFEELESFLTSRI